ncbi:MAG: hypothetical protein RR490_09135 [Niameybacter sp.]
MYPIDHTIACLRNKINDIVQPFFLGRYYYIGDKAVSDNTLYVCIKTHQSSPEIFIGDPLYWVADFGGLVESKKKPVKVKKGE